MKTAKYPYFVLVKNGDTLTPPAAGQPVRQVGVNLVTGERIMLIEHWEEELSKLPVFAGPVSNRSIRIKWFRLEGGRLHMCSPLIHVGALVAFDKHERKKGLGGNRPRLRVTDQHLFLPCSLMLRHLLVMARTGDLKSVWLTYISSFLLACTDVACVPIDAGYDMFMFFVHRFIAAETGRDFRHWPGHAFDPFSIVYPLTRESVPRAASFVQAMASLDGNQVDPRSQFFARLSYAYLASAFARAVAVGEFAPTPRRLIEHMRFASKQLPFRNVPEPMLFLEGLSHTPNTSLTPSSSHNLMIPSVIDSGGIAYFSVPELYNPGDRPIGAAAKGAVTLACLDRKKQKLTPRRTVKLQDEAGATFSQADAIDLLLSRKFGVADWLIGQNPALFGQYWEHIDHNTAFKLFMTPFDSDSQRYILDRCQEVYRDHLPSARGQKSLNYDIYGADENIERERSIEINQILEIASRKGFGFAFIDGLGTRHFDPVPVKFEPLFWADDVFNKSAHDRISDLPYPELPPVNAVIVPRKAMTPDRKASIAAARDVLATQRKLLDPFGVFDNRPENNEESSCV